MSNSLKNRIIKLALAALIGALAFVLLYGRYSCPFYAFTGMPCPGCGLSRAALALLALDLAAAARFNPMIFVLLPYGALAAGIYLARGKITKSRIFWASFAIIGLIFLVMRIRQIASGECFLPFDDNAILPKLFSRY